MANLTRMLLSSLILPILTPGLPPAAQASPSENSKLQVSIRPVGLDEAQISILSKLALESSGALANLQGARFRILGASFPALETEDKERQGPTEEFPKEFRVDVYDYTHNRLLHLSGDTRMQNVRIQETNDQPPPSPEEIDEAVYLLRQNPYFSGAKSNEWKIYRSMPGIVDGPDLDHPTATRLSTDRVIAIGILPTSKKSRFKHEIVGVNLSKGVVIRYANGAPPTSVVTERVCAPSSANQPITGYGIPGQAVITVQKEGTELWRFTAIRPSSSSGFRGSGIDLRDITYQGKKVLSQIHVPILNVQYVNNVCGPYRDWTYSEGMFQANGEYIAQGILQARERPRTIFDTNRDFGNFHGIAVYTDGPRLILTSEMEAGLYRYKSEFVFNENGEIQPRWGFSGVQSSCTCNPHRHHAYFRMDFDIGDGKQNQVQVLNGTDWSPIPRETRFRRDLDHRQFRVVDLNTGRGYSIVPGQDDGIADRYAQADIWTLKFHQGEIDDSAYYRGTAANLDPFLNREDIESADIVLWYSAHFYHHSDNFERDGNQIVGPTLKPLQWH